MTVFKVLALSNFLFFMWLFIAWSNKTFLNQLIKLLIFVLVLCNGSWAFTLFFPDFIK
jgi:hypothetical protein